MSLIIVISGLWGVAASRVNMPNGLNTPITEANPKFAIGLLAFGYPPYRQGDKDFL